MVTVRDILEVVPREDIKAALGVKDSVIRMARERNWFAASWYLEMRRLCKEHGIDCPESLFSFKVRPGVPNHSRAGNE